MTRYRSAPSPVAVTERPAPTGDGLTVDVRLVPWNTPKPVREGSRITYTESWAPGSLLMPDDGGKVYVEVDHFGKIVGRLTRIRNGDDAAYGELRIADTTEGRDLLALIDAAVVDQVSIEFDDPAEPPPGGSITRTRAVLRAVAFTLTPQYHEAAVIGRRSDPEGRTIMPDNNDTPPDSDVDDAATDDGTPAVAAAPPPADTRVRSITRPDPSPAPRQAPSLDRAVGGAQAGARFRSLGHFVQAVIGGEVEGDELARYRRSLDLNNWTPDGTGARRYRALGVGSSAAQDGLIHEEWIDDVIDLVRTYTPTVESFATAALPEAGNSVSMPTVATRPTTAVQTEGAEIESTAVVIDDVNYAKQTFAGGQGITIQTLRWSSPDYVTQVMSLHLRQMAQDLNTAVVAAVEAAVPGSGTPGTGHVVDATADFRDDLVDASALILADLRRFPDFVLLPTAIWQSLAKTDASGDGRPLYGAIAPTNAAGTVAVALSGQTLNLPFRVEPSLTATTVIVGVREAFTTMRSAVGTLAADTVATLSRDVAVYQFAAYGATDANGLAAIDSSV